MPIQKELLSEDQWHEQKRKFRDKCIFACIQENLNRAPTDKRTFSQVIYEMCEECFLMGEVFGGDVLTDEEVEAMNQRAEKKLDDMGTPLPK